MKKPTTNDLDSSVGQLDLKIESMAFGGSGVGRHDGKVYFVTDAIEGDTVRAQITEDSGRYCEAKTIEILSPSEFRGPSPCEFSDRCGGCQWQGVPYFKQLEWKKNFVLNAVNRIGKVLDHSAIEIIGSPQTSHYRNRIFLRARIDKSGELSVGYFMKGSREFVPINACGIGSSRLNVFIQQLTRIKLNYQILPQMTEDIRFRFEIQDLPVNLDGAPHILATVYDPDNHELPVQTLVDHFAQIPSVAWVGSHRDVHKSSNFLFERDLDLDFYTSPSLFQQINVEHNHLVRRLVRDSVSEISARRVLDIFCGSGNLSLPCVSAGRQIDGVEFSSRAIEVAKFNLSANNLTGAEYFAGDTEKFLWRAARQGVLYDLVIADPPREGMYKCLIPLVKINPKRIIYVSCDPTTLARDIGSLYKSGFRITKFVCLDFFPNTYHVESFVVLDR